MALMFGRVRQDTYDVQSEGMEHNARMNPRGELVVADWMTQLVLDGRVYNASTVAHETAAAIATNGIVSTGPALLLSIPTGTTVIPLEIILAAAADASASDTTVQICTDDAAGYASGGVAVTPINMRKDDPNTSSATFYTGSTAIVYGANVDDDTIYAAMVDSTAVVGTLGSGQPQVYWTARQYIPPVLIGPASLLVFIGDTGGTSTWYYSVKWASFSTTDIT